MQFYKYCAPANSHIHTHCCSTEPGPQVPAQDGSLSSGWTTGQPLDVWRIVSVRGHSGKCLQVGTRCHCIVFVVASTEVASCDLFMQIFSFGTSLDPNVDQLSGRRPDSWSSLSSRLCTADHSRVWLRKPWSKSQLHDGGGRCYSKWCCHGYVESESQQFSLERTQGKDVTGNKKCLRKRFSFVAF